LAYIPEKVMICDEEMKLSGGKKPVIITNYYNKTVLLPLSDNKCD
jgi:hypothetical protein